jgi:hypothetical protein
MPNRYDVRPATLDDVNAVAALLRPEDVDELKAYNSELDAHEGVLLAFRLSAHTWVGTINDEPACLFGVYEPKYFGTIGCPWFRGSTRMAGHTMAFLRASRGVVAGLLDHYTLLSNAVDASNRKAIQWLEWLGFEVDDELIYLPGSDTAFRRYRKRSGK